MGGKQEVAKFLLAKGADAEQQDRDGLSARDWARENGHKNVLDTLIVVPRGVRGSSGKFLSRTAFPRQELSILFLILLAVIWLRAVVRGVCPHPRWRCRSRSLKLCSR